MAAVTASRGGPAGQLLFHAIGDTDDGLIHQQRAHSEHEAP